MQVLLNLQSNALKFTREGGVTHVVEIVEEEMHSGTETYLKISVRDSGIGIPWEDQDKLFKLFGFVQSTQQYNKNGIGLGLVISERISKKFGGTIGFNSVPHPEKDHGTTFYFSFKLESKSTYERSQGEDNNESGGYELNSRTLVFDYKPVVAAPLAKVDSKGSGSCDQSPHSLITKQNPKHLVRPLDLSSSDVSFGEIDEPTGHTPTPSKQLSVQIRQHN